MTGTRPANSSAIRHWGLWLAALWSLVGYGALVLIDWLDGTLRAGTTPTTITVYLIVFAGFLFAVWWNERATIPIAWFWAVPILARVVLWLTEPTLSDDVYRYIWDGHLMLQGVSPYSHAISAAEVDGYEITARTLANNPGLASPYLPVALVVFAAAVLLGPDIATTMQVVMTGFDLGAAVLLYRLLPTIGLPARRALIYLWNPLVIVEIAHGAHLDGLMVFLVMVSLWAMAHRPTGYLSPIALALAVLTRPVPLLLTPVLWWRWNWPQRLAFTAVTVGLVVPFGFGRSGWGLSPSTFGVGVFGSARVYSSEFRFNAAVSAWLERTLGESSTGFSLVTGGLMASVGLFVWLRARHHTAATPEAARATVRLAMVLIVAYTVLTPVLHPWYLMMAITLAPMVTPAAGESAMRWVLLVPLAYLTAVVSLSYLTYRDPDAFGELDWVRQVEWLPTIGLGLVAAVAFRWAKTQKTHRPDQPEFRH